MLNLKTSLLLLKIQTFMVVYNFVFYISLIALILPSSCLFLSHILNALIICVALNGLFCADVPIRIVTRPDLAGGPGAQPNYGSTIRIWHRLRSFTGHGTITWVDLCNRGVARSP